jgi:hypothetical protein
MSLRTFLSFYKNLPFQLEMDVRYYCAWNLPALAQILGGHRFIEHCSAIFTKLSKDEHEKVRMCVAKGLHQVK